MATPAPQAATDVTEIELTSLEEAQQASTDAPPTEGTGAVTHVSNPLGSADDDDAADFDDADRGEVAMMDAGTLSIVQKEIHEAFMRRSEGKRGAYVPTEVRLLTTLDSVEVDETEMLGAAKFIASSPCRTLVLVVLVVAACILSMLFPTVKSFDIDLSYASYTVDGSAASEDYSKLLAAEQSSYETIRRQQSRGGRRTSASNERTSLGANMNVIFQSSENLLHPTHLRTIHDIEQRIQRHELYQQFRQLPTDEIFVNSISRVMFPNAVNSTTTDVQFDGTGRAANVSVALGLLNSWGKEGYLSKDYSYDTNRVSRTIECWFQFGLPLAGFTGVRDQRKVQLSRLNDAFVGMMPFLRELSTDTISVYFEGLSTYEAEFLQFLKQDLLLVTFSVLFIFTFVWFHVGHFTLALAAVTMILISFPIVIFFYRVVMGHTNMGILNFVSLWIVLGIGVDDVFVFHDTWVSAKQLVCDGKPASLELRLSWTMRESGTAMFMTSFTTSAAFFGSAVSRIAPIRYFGELMGGLVVLNLVLTLTWYAAVTVWLDRKSGSIETTTKLKSDTGCFWLVTSWLSKTVNSKRPATDRNFFSIFHEYLHVVRWPVFVLFLGGIIAAISVAPQLKPTSESFKFLPSDSNGEMVRDLRANELAVCSGCTFDAPGPERYNYSGLPGNVNATQLFARTGHSVPPVPAAIAQATTGSSTSAAAAMTVCGALLELIALVGFATSYLILTAGERADSSRFALDAHKRGYGIKIFFVAVCTLVFGLALLTFGVTNLVHPNRDMFHEATTTAMEFVFGSLSCVCSAIFTGLLVSKRKSLTRSTMVNYTGMALAFFVIGVVLITTASSSPVAPSSVATSQVVVSDDITPVVDITPGQAKAGHSGSIAEIAVGILFSLVSMAVGSFAMYRKAQTRTTAFKRIMLFSGTILIVGCILISDGVSGLKSAVMSGISSVPDSATAGIASATGSSTLDPAIQMVFGSICLFFAFIICLGVSLRKPKLTPRQALVLFLVWVVFVVVGSSLLSAGVAKLGPSTSQGSPAAQESEAANPVANTVVAPRPSGSVGNSRYVLEVVFGPVLQFVACVLGVYAVRNRKQLEPAKIFVLSAVVISLFVVGTVLLVLGYHGLHDNSSSTPISQHSADISHARVEADSKRNEGVTEIVFSVVNFALSQLICISVAVRKPLLTRKQAILLVTTVVSLLASAIVLAVQGAHDLQSTLASQVETVPAAVDSPTPTPTEPPTTAFGGPSASLVEIIFGAVFMTTSVLICGFVSRVKLSKPATGRVVLAAFCSFILGVVLLAVGCAGLDTVADTDSAAAVPSGNVDGVTGGASNFETAFVFGVGVLCLASSVPLFILSLSAVRVRRFAGVLITSSRSRAVQGMLVSAILLVVGSLLADSASRTLNNATEHLAITASFLMLGAGVFCVGLVIRWSFLGFKWLREFGASAPSNLRKALMCMIGTSAVLVVGSALMALAAPSIRAAVSESKVLAKEKHQTSKETATAVVFGVLSMYSAAVFSIFSYVHCSGKAVLCLKPTVSQVGARSPVWKTGAVMFGCLCIGIALLSSVKGETIGLTAEGHQGLLGTGTTLVFCSLLLFASNRAQVFASPTKKQALALFLGVAANCIGVILLCVDSRGVISGNDASIASQTRPVWGHNSSSGYDLSGVVVGDRPTVLLPFHMYGKMFLLFGVKSVEDFASKVSDPVYDPTFKPSSPEVQLALLGLCSALKNATSVVARPEVCPTSSYGYKYGCACLPEFFQHWVQDYTALPYPVPPDDYDKAMKDFLDVYHYYFGKDVVFDDNGKVVSLAMRVAGRFHNEAPGTVLAAARGDWRRLMETVNSQSPVGLENGVQVSQTWVRLAVELEFVNGTLYACAIATLCSFLAIVFFVQNLAISFYTTAVVLGMMVCMVATMVVRGKGLGVVEALSIAIMVGMSVDYVIHIAHAYNHSVLVGTFARSRSALLARGRSVVGAGVTTAGASVILLFCNIQLFPSFGVVLLTLTSLSVVFSLVFFSSILMIFGPVKRKRLQDEVLEAFSNTFELGGTVSEEPPRTSQPDQTGMIAGALQVPAAISL
jgi:predicted RND superfamily exporter protein